jgi:Co/Zn/Cd efflux system component
MSTDCCSHDDNGAAAPASPRCRRALSIALALNAAMAAAIEISGGIGADSASLLADAADFFGDAANYALSLGALALAATWRSRVAMLKGATMALYGAGVLVLALWNALHGAAPEPATMALIGTLALAVNAGLSASDPHAPPHAPCRARSASD